MRAALTFNLDLPDEARQHKAALTGERLADVVLRWVEKVHWEADENSPPPGMTDHWQLGMAEARSMLMRMLEDEGIDLDGLTG